MEKEKTIWVSVQNGTATMEVSAEQSSNFKMFLNRHASQLPPL